MNPITISTVTAQIAQLFERDELFRNVWVIGEVSNWKRAASGHLYFNLKDSGASMSAVMWKGNALTHTWLPKDGDQIIAHGYIGVYPERGVYQLYADRIQPAGRGQLYMQFENLKIRLAAEGLFDAQRKRPLPEHCGAIGIITSADAAALRDILRVLSARWPLVEVLLFPTLVQGAEAPAQIIQALNNANIYSATVRPLDLLLLARGGGSIEDLWAFNDEGVAYTIAQSKLPVVSGVGHETDFTIADFVADLRAPTPSAAAAAITPDRTDVIAQLAEVRARISQQAQNLLFHERKSVTQLRRRLQRIDPKRRLDARRQAVDDRQRRLHQTMQRYLTRLADRNYAVATQLDALNPLNVLRRGYSIVQRADGMVVTAPTLVAPDEPLRVRTAGGDFFVQPFHDRLKIVPTPIDPA